MSSSAPTARTLDEWTESLYQLLTQKHLWQKTRTALSRQHKTRNAFCAMLCAYVSFRNLSESDAIVREEFMTSLGKAARDSGCAEELLGPFKMPGQIAKSSLVRLLGRLRSSIRNRRSSARAEHGCVHLFDLFPLLCRVNSEEADNLIIMLLQ